MFVRGWDGKILIFGLVLPIIVLSVNEASVKTEIVCAEILVLLLASSRLKGEDHNILLKFTLLKFTTPKFYTPKSIRQDLY